MITASLDDIDIIEAIHQGRGICLDYGSKRIGTAISDMGWEISSPLKVLDTPIVFNQILQILREYRVGLFIVGIPIALNGGWQGRQHKQVNEFTKKLHAFLNSATKHSYNILQYDERLSTVAASRILSEANLSIKGRQKNIDKLAANFILQGVLDRIRYRLSHRDVNQKIVTN